MAAKLAFIFLAFGFSLAFPADSIYDRASVHDVELNSVHSDQTFVARDGTTEKKAVRLVEVATSAPDGTVNLDTPVSNFNPPQAPQHPGTGFARIIDDIFQIPITVLQSVAKLLTNPFKQQVKTPEASSTY